MDAERLEKAKWLWFADALGCASPLAGKILRRVDAIDALIEVFHDGKPPIPETDWDITVPPDRARALRTMCPEDYFARLDQCDAKGIQIVTWADECYPDLLREIAAPPPVLYYRGDITIPNSSFMFAIIGARRPSAYGIEATQKIAEKLAESGVVLVSGLATGLDGECHKAALRANRETVACLAFGVDLCYPAEHAALKTEIEQRGLVLSEYPPEVPPMRQNFLQRNRLIAGLSHGVCVAEARRRSGTMNTVGAAVDAGRDVFAVPGNIFWPMCEGTNQLLVEGAHAVRCGEDVLSFYNSELRRYIQSCQAQPAPEEKPGDPEQEPDLNAEETWEEPPWSEELSGGESSDGPAQGAEDALPLSRGAQVLRGALKASGAQPLEELCGKTGLPYPQLAAAATELEFADIAIRTANGQYQLKS